MLNASTIEQLRAMKFSAMAAAFEHQLKDPKSSSQLGFEERFGLMVDAEWNRRQDNKLVRYIRNAHFSDASATMEGIEYIEDRHLDKGKMLRLRPAGMLMRVGTSSSKAHPETERPILPVHLAMLPAASSRQCDTSVCLNFWTN